MFNASKFHWEKESEKWHNHRQIEHYWEELPCQTEWIIFKESKNKTVQGKKNIMWKFSEKCTYQHMRNKVVEVPCWISGKLIGRVEFPYWVITDANFSQCFSL